MSSFFTSELPKRELRDVRRVYDTQGKVLERVYDVDNGWRSYRPEPKFPVPKDAFNFEVPGPDKSVPFLTVLDPYGDAIFSNRMRRSILGERSSGRSSGPSETIGIRHDTGEVVRVGFVACGTDVGLTLASFPVKIVLPMAYRARSRLAELLSKKRPFRLTLRSDDLFRFVDRWSGYRDLQDSVVVDLSFEDSRLQVSPECWRTVAEWRETT